MNVQATDSMRCAIEVPKDHPSYAGHFPNHPVLPGAVLLDETLRAIQRARGIDLTRWRIASAKFPHAVRPGDALRLEHAAAHSGLIRFTVYCAERIVATGSLSSTAE